MNHTRSFAFLGGLMALVMLLHPLFAGRASAAVVYSQNFDALSTGNLEGQDSWTRGAGTADMYQVVDSPYHYNPNAFRFSGSGSNVITRAIDTINENAYFTIWFKTATTTATATIVLGDSSPPGYPVFRIDATGYLAAIGASCYPYNGTTLINLTDGNWYKMRVEYRDSDGFFRIGIAGYTCGLGGSEFTEWADPAPQSITDIANINFNEGNGQYVYFDDLVIGSGSSPGEAPIPIYSIDLTYPLDEAIVPDFNAWGLDYIFYTGTTSYTIFDIVVNTYPTATSTSIWYQDRIKLYDFIPDSTTTRSTTINKQFAFGALKTWYAKAFLVQGFTGDIFAESDPISFTIATSTAGIWTQPPTSTSTSAEFVITCDPTDPFFERSLCKLAVWLFAPQASDLDVFTDIKNLVITKPPFGYLSATIAALGDLTATTTPEVDLPVVPGLGSEVKSVVAIILWVLALLHTFNRLRYFDL